MVMVRKVVSFFVVCCAFSNVIFAEEDSTQDVDLLATCDALKKLTGQVLGDAKDFSEWETTVLREAYGYAQAGQYVAARTDDGDKCYQKYLPYFQAVADGANKEIGNRDSTQDDVKKWTPVAGSTLTVIAVGSSSDGGSSDGENHYREPDFVKHAINCDNERIEVASQVGTYHESPYLGNVEGLLSTEKRIPMDPVIVNPGTFGMSELGQFGGVFSVQGPRWSEVRYGINGIVPFRETGAQRRSDLLPGPFKSVEALNGNRVFTAKLRTCLRWSDGDLSTTEDILFWWNDYVRNPDFGRGIPDWLVQGDAVATISALDDVTLRIEFPNPYPGFDIAFQAFQATHQMAIPKHYLKDFHKSYANEEMLSQYVEAAGFEDWTQLFNFHRDPVVGPETATPMIAPWVGPSRLQLTSTIWSRNPYYYAVDSEGMQLPYMDEQHVHITPNAGGRDLRVLTGEISVASVGLPKVEIHKEAADRGDVQMIPFSFLGDHAERTLSFNWFAQDPFKAEMFRDKRFRLAMSYWAPRQLISDLEFDGLAPLRQIGVSDPSSPWYVEELATLAVERDLDKANALLDEIGLTNKDADGFRLDPDGNRITLTIVSIAGWFDDTWSLLIEELPKIGFKGEFRGVGWGGRGEVIDNLDWEIIGWQSLTGYGNRDWPSNFGGDYSSLHPSNTWSRPWYLWLNSGGAQGEQPPAFAQEMWDLAQGAKLAETDEQLTDRIIALQKLQAEHLIGIDLVQLAPRFRVYAPDIGNTQESFLHLPAIYYHKDPMERAKTLGGSSARGFFPGPRGRKIRAIRGSFGMGLSAQHLPVPEERQELQRRHHMDTCPRPRSLAFVDAVAGDPVRAELFADPVKPAVVAPVPPLRRLHLHGDESVAGLAQQIHLHRHGCASSRAGIAAWRTRRRRGPRQSARSPTVSRAPLRTADRQFCPDRARATPQSNR